MNSVSYDWFNIEFEDMKEEIFSRFEKGDKLLHVGCGNSTWGAKFVDFGFHVVNVDYAMSVIELMKNSFPNLNWMHGDARSLELENQTFDIVFDKGTIDGMNTSDSTRADIKLVSKEMWRLLKKNDRSRWIICSMLEQECLLKIIDSMLFKIDYTTIRKDKSPQIYVLKPILGFQEL